jgi:hypothetical protein
MKIGTLRNFLCALAVGAALFLGMSIETQAQEGRRSSYGRWRERNYGQQVSTRRHYRNSLRRSLRRHQWFERRSLNNRLRWRREHFGNSREWRLRQRQERAALRLHQRQERNEFKRRWRNNRDWR